MSFGRSRGSWRGWRNSWRYLFKEVEPLPDELEAIEEFKKEKDNLELIPLEEVERELSNSN
ncbi:hypothetical protein IPA_01895 [Ignicoccus pacificus DSM 13166]|uniref:Uncharacterized protein n=1 Tax=Ignicoccus pacificus DSM 13166 TaxID=940294 RepID=A0A977KC30_9CREN|nr:hypothetical protein IPA_01895 [Ignicoccus pacificus DSM 13166]